MYLTIENKDNLFFAAIKPGCYSVSRVLLFSLLRCSVIFYKRSPPGHVSTHKYRFSLTTVDDLLNAERKINMEVSNLRKYFAELIGTMVLVFMGCGSAIIIGCGGLNSAGTVAVALTFGLSIVAMAYVIGPISGCHINPAVSLGALITKRMGWKDFIGYVIFQVIGGIIAGAMLWALVKYANVFDQTGGLGSNGLGGVGGSAAGGFFVEVILTFIFVLVILGVTSDRTKGAVSGIVIGLTLTFVHLVGIGLTGTSVNPARSIGPALFSSLSSSLPDLWVFIVAPLVGAAIAAGVFIGLYGWKKASGEESI